MSATDSVKMRVRILTSCKNRVKTSYKQEERTKRGRDKERKRRRVKETKSQRGKERKRQSDKKKKGQRQKLRKPLEEYGGCAAAVMLPFWSYKSKLLTPNRQHPRAFFQKAAILFKAINRNKPFNGSAMNSPPTPPYCGSVAAALHLMNSQIRCK